MRLPAAIGGAPAFDAELPFARPARPSLEAVMARVAPSYEQGRLTNGPIVRALEEAVAERLGIDHVVAVSSCTAGLMLVIQALAPGTTAVVPSFTFSATAHAAVWNGCRLVFADCDPFTFQLDVDDAAVRMDTAGILLATHVFGSPCSAEQLEAVARSAGVPVLFDAAAAFGALRNGRPVGTFGDAEVFSLTPTKPLVGGEGGLVTTSRADVAKALVAARDYGNEGDYDPAVAGLNARMSEMHAAIALESLAELDEHLARRQDLAARYREGLANLPGISIQAVGPGDVSTYKDLTIQVDPDAYGVSRDVVSRALTADGIDTRAYF